MLFIALFLILSWHNRLASDDFHFLWRFNEFGVLGTTAIEYNVWSTRWTAVTLIGSILFLRELTPTVIFILGVAGLAVFIASVLLLIRNLARIIGLANEVNENQRTSVLLNIAVFIVSIIFVGTIRVDETWMLFCASCVYLWSAMLLVLGAAWIVHPVKNVLFAILGTFSFIYIGGALGPLAIHFLNGRL